MTGVTVHSPVADEPGEVHGAAARLRLGKRRQDDGVGGQFAGPDCLVDPGDPLVDDEPGADVEVPDFGIAHLALGQTNALAGGQQGRMRIVGEEAVEDRGVRQGYGVARSRQEQCPIHQG